ncbi:alpha/beta hydrolase [Sinorhizobium terangae]|uniref:alpha/beta hydrolase n=1 Tax=Sinorhizobium terangae TaxID=110322 RepID=UPI0024B282B7|nr:alpha/beta hydrolase [Sinorhizobium terangae]WFU51352.1 alpha/beta hydrolase [Sinorhizobium terangae]
MARLDEPDYIFRDRHPERSDVYALYDKESERMRRDAFCLFDLPYGRHPRMTFDLFPGENHAPLAVFFHGGYWQSLDKQRFSFVARSLLARGFSVALPNYPLAPEMPLEAIAGTARSCLPAIFAALTRQTGSPPSSFLTTGHSAGGHLSIWAGMHASADPIVASVPFAGMVPISGIFDVRPLVGTSLNKALKLTIRRAARLSPIGHELPTGQYRVFVGADETLGFLRQAALFTGELNAAGHDAALFDLTGLNHYTILMDLLSANSAIARVIEGMVGMGGDCAGRRNDYKKQNKLRQL